MPAKRRIHLGIDYGTSTSKIVFRDYGAPGGEMAYVMLREDGTFRIPSRVCLHGAELIFGNDSLTEDDSDIYESVKMQVAVEVTGKPKYYYGPPKELPVPFTATDLAVLTVWYLISEGNRAISAYLDRQQEGVSVGMTMGIPMSFFKESRLQSAFLGIARKAWALYRSEGLLGTSLLTDRAQRLLAKHADAASTVLPDYEVREWIRSEAEAAMWWPFQSPAIASGPYAKVDIGAGTTNASFYRIYGQNAKTGLAFLGAVSVATGMDAIDRAISEADDVGGDWLALRGLEQSILAGNAKARGAILPVCEDIYEAYRRSWVETFEKIKGSVAELNAWAHHRVFVIGGGSTLPALVNAMRVHPGRKTTLALAALEEPADLKWADNNKVARKDMPFVTVAYGLSNIGLSIPEALTPDQVPPMPDLREIRKRIDTDDIYAK